MESYFKTAPCVTWKDYAWSLLPIGQLQEPTYIPLKIPSHTLTINTGTETGTFPSIAKSTIEQARELSDFLAQYYYDTKSSYSLVISPNRIHELLQKQQAISLVLYDSHKHLIACIFEFYMGVWNNKSAGLITWLCVHPSWRKKGVANLLYYSLGYHVTGAADIKWFRNDSLWKSPLPPIWYQSMMSRRIRGNVSQRVRQSSMDFETLEFVGKLWKTLYPNGIAIMPTAPPTAPTALTKSTLQLWVYNSVKARLWIFVQPTYEILKKTGERICEIVAIVPQGFKDLYEQTQAFEEVVDSLPWNICEAPTEIPHIESFWLKAGMSTWSTVGLHPGKPFQRRVFSALAV